MASNWLSLVLIGLLAQGGTPAMALHQSPDAATSRDAAAAAEQKIRSLVIGSRIEVRLRGGDRIRGGLGLVEATGFEIQVPKKKVAQPLKVAFADVESVRHIKGLSTGAKIGIGIAIGVGLAALVAALTLGAIARNG